MTVQYEKTDKEGLNPFDHVFPPPRRISCCVNISKNKQFWLKLIMNLFTFTLGYKTVKSVFKVNIYFGIKFPLRTVRSALRSP